jgi:hypothetical protein
VARAKSDTLNCELARECDGRVYVRGGRINRLKQDASGTSEPSLAAASAQDIFARSGDLAEQGTAREDASARGDGCDARDSVAVKKLVRRIGALIGDTRGVDVGEILGHDLVALSGGEVGGGHDFIAASLAASSLASGSEPGETAASAAASSSVSERLEALGLFGRGDFGGSGFGGARRLGAAASALSASVMAKAATVTLPSIAAVSSASVAL